MQSMRTNQRAGFTLIEVMVIAPIIILFIGAFIGLIVGLTGDSLQTRTSNEITYQVQSALDTIEAENGRSLGGYLTTTGTLTTPQGSDNATTAFTVTNNDASSTDNDTLILRSPATTLDPISPDRALIRYNSPNSCTATNASDNPYYPITNVYFVASGTLWQRTILPSSGTPCSTPWQKGSCAASQSLAGVCKVYDTKLVDNVSSFSVQYLKADGSNQAASSAGSATSIKVTIATSKSVAGRAITYTSSMRSAAASVTNDPVTVTFNYTGSIQSWTVPTDVTSITVLAKGAQGGSGLTYTGGLGASMQGTFAVTPGQVLKILVGQQGFSDTSYKASGGGGGSFVTTSANSPLIVAGGGGGGGGNSSPSNGSPGLTTTTGGSSPSFSGGTGGGGGAAGTGSSGGGGLTGNGTSSGYSGPGLSFTNGGTGGTGGNCALGVAGGFGGGSGGEWCSMGATGAGGGYSGGAGVNSTGVAGGGGSYNNGTGQTNTSGVQSGNGQIKITYTSGGGSSGSGVGTNTATFAYTGSSQTWQVPTGITQVQIECWGAEGATSVSGKGGYAKGNLTVTPGQTLYIYVGQAGVLASGSGMQFTTTTFNGGGRGTTYNATTGGGSGGGASDVRTTTALSTRIIVAGGGGSGYPGNGGDPKGGDGGGTTGSNGVDYPGYSGSAGQGGTQSAGGYRGQLNSGGSTIAFSGALGQGGDSPSNNYGGGGGGGYYGGGGGDNTAGGGGSSYIGGVTGGTTTTGGRSGNGQVKITY